MYYTIDKETLQPKIEEEVSLVADEAYGDNGASLYDSIIITEKDKGMVERFIDTAVSAITTRMYDICKLFKSDDTAEGNLEQIYFHVPDFDETMEATVTEELSRFIVLFTCSCIFEQRRPAVVPQFSERAKAALDKAVTLLKSRKSPIDIW